MGKGVFPPKGLFITALLSGLFLLSCTSSVEKRFSDRLVVKEEYVTPVEVKKALLTYLKRGGERIELLLRNSSGKKLLLECQIFFLTGEGLKVSVPGFERFLCALPPSGTKRVKIELPLVGVEWKTAVVKIRPLVEGHP